jgi:hypothetical protein
MKTKTLDSKNTLKNLQHSILLQWFVGIMLVGPALWFGLNSRAEDTAQEIVKKSPEAVQVGQIKKQILELRASKGAYLLMVLDSSAIITPEIVKIGNADADIRFIDEKDKSHYQLQVGYRTNDAPAKVFAALGIEIPSTWTVEEFEPETILRYSIPATQEPEQKMAEFIHNFFTKVCKLPSSYELKFSKQ